jgi:hypothetical protein
LIFYHCCKFKRPLSFLARKNVSYAVSCVPVTCLGRVRQDIGLFLKGGYQLGSSLNIIFEGRLCLRLPLISNLIHDYLGCLLAIRIHEDDKYENIKNLAPESTYEFLMNKKQGYNASS